MTYDYEIRHRPDSSLLLVKLKDQEIKVEPGAMVYMAGNIEIETKTGGLFSALKRAVVGESVFMNTFKGTGILALSPGYEGDIIPIDLNETGEIYLQKGAYLASSPDVNIEVKTSFRGLIGGLGLFLMKISGSGTAFISTFGALEEIELSGDKIIVDNGNLVGFTSGLNYEVKKIGGLKSFIFGGEGLVYEISGHGKVYIQTRSLESFVDTIAPFLPKK